MMIRMLFQSPTSFLLLAAAIVISLCVHEFSHAFVAYKLGDPTAKLMGRMTLNPKAHLDPLGTIFLLIAGFGWGKPVPFNPLNLKNPKRDSALISLAGPTSNFILAFLLSLPLKLLHLSTQVGIGEIFVVILILNLMLGFFNLIPLGPLDGNKVVAGFLPMKLMIQWNEMQRFGMYILLFLVITNSTGKILVPLVDMAMKILGVYLR